MTLSDILKNYRKEHGISQRQLGDLCGVSHSTITYVEKGINPNTGKPLIPQIPLMEKLASGMGITVDELMQMSDDMPGKEPGNSTELSITKRKFIESISNLDDDQIIRLQAIVDMVKQDRSQDSKS